jgi:hypothetical protein
MKDKSRAEARGQFWNLKEGKSAVGSRYQKTGEDSD